MQIMYIVHPKIALQHIKIDIVQTAVYVSSTSQVIKYLINIYFNLRSVYAQTLNDEEIEPGFAGSTTFVLQTRTESMIALSRASKSIHARSLVFPPLDSFQTCFVRS